MKYEYLKSNRIPIALELLFVLDREHFIYTNFLFYALLTIFLPPVAEEIFCRKNLIFFHNSKILTLTTISACSYILEHTLSPWGIALCMIWALLLSLSYIKTKNVYVVMTAHFICNVLINGVTVVQIIEFC